MLKKIKLDIILLCIALLPGISSAGELDPGTKTIYQVEYDCGDFMNHRTKGSVPLLRCSSGNSTFSTKCLVGSAELGESMEVNISSQNRLVQFSANIDLDSSKKSPSSFKFRLVEIEAQDLANGENVGGARFFTSSFPDYVPWLRDGSIDLGAYLFSESNETWGYCGLILSKTP